MAPMRSLLRRLLHALLIGLAAASISAAALSAQTPTGRGTAVPDRLLLKFAPGAAASAQSAALAAVGARQVDRIEQIDVRILSVPATRRANALQALRRNPNVLFAEEDLVTLPDATPNDPYYKSQWHLPKIAAPTAWDHTVGSGSVIIAILDTGVDPAHPDLEPLLVPGWNFYDNNDDSSDVYGHGTAVAGSAAAASNNAMGIAAVAWACRIMPIRVSSPTGGGSFTAMAKGLTWSSDRGARVANISYNAAGRSATVATAAQYFQARGGVVTISAGNDGSYVAAAENPYALTVSATGSNDVLTSFSNTGPHISVAAPGSGIYTTANGGGYRSASGTSFSAPIAAGVAALVIAANPGLSGAQAREIVMRSADDLGASGWDTQFGWGRVNAQRAVEHAKGASATDLVAPAVVLLTPKDGSVVSGTATLHASASDAGGVVGMELYVGAVRLASSPGSSITHAWDTALMPDGHHELVAIAWDAAGNVGTVSAAVLVANASDLTPPVAAILSPEEGALVGKSVKVAVRASDDREITKLTLLVNDVVWASVGPTSSITTFSWNTTKLPKGAYRLRALAHDAAGNVGASPERTVSLVK